MTSLLFRPTSTSNRRGNVDEASDFYLTLPPINHGGSSGRIQEGKHRSQHHHEDELLAVTDFEDESEDHRATTTTSPHLKVLEGGSHQPTLTDYHPHLLVPTDNFLKGSPSGGDDYLSCASNSFIVYPERNKTLAEFV
jgi:hypothetical protein